MQNPMYDEVMAGPGNVQSADNRRPIVQYFDDTMMNLERLAISVNHLTEQLSPVIFMAPSVAASEEFKTDGGRTEVEEKFINVNAFINTIQERVNYLRDNVVL